MCDISVHTFDCKALGADMMGLADGRSLLGMVVHATFY